MKLILTIIICAILAFSPIPIVQKPPLSTEQATAPKTSVAYAEEKKPDSQPAPAIITTPDPAPVQATAPAEPVAPTPAPVQQAPLQSGSHEDWMSAAGIAASDYGYVDYIVSHESGWNPNAVNASSGAEGLPQALPYSKTGCVHGNATCQLIWADAYAVGRYGSWAGAYAFWTSHHWW